MAASVAESVTTLAGATFSAGFTAAMTAGFGAILAVSDTPVVTLADSILVSGDRPLEFSTATTSPSGGLVDAVADVGPVHLHDNPGDALAPLAAADFLDRLDAGRPARLR